ncbi:MAG: Ca2+-dependent phosphoinositide-specific phospholipase C [Hyphomonadaceae bacterium]
MKRLFLIAASFSALGLAACQETGAPASLAVDASACDLAAPTADAAGEGCARSWIDANLKMNDMQVLGTHNSYKQWISPNELQLFAERSPAHAKALEYAHEPIPAQLDWGIRQLEIDIVYDPEGGVYLDPLLRRQVIERGLGAPDLAFKEELAKPGFKVMHVPDIDYRTSCPTLVACLTQIRNWSKAHPDHAPMFIMLNTKDSAVDIPGAAPVRRFDAAAWDALDAEVLSVFPRTSLITPADIQGDYASVREGVLADNWPVLGEARSRVMIGILASRTSTEPYRNVSGGIKTRPMFVRAVSADPDAAWLMWDDPIVNQDAIHQAVKDGFIVRTRTEQDTVEVRANTTVKRSAAFASGGQYISTDYYKPNLNFSDYAVAMPGGAIARCNPLRAADKCGDARIE